MPVQDESAALVVLLRGGRRAWQVYADLVEEAGSAIAVLEQECAERAGQASLFGDPVREQIARAAAEIEAWSAEGMRVLTVLDPGYPENLRAVHDRPPLIFVAGRLDPRDARSVAVVGARTAIRARARGRTVDRRAARRPRLHGRQSVWPPGSTPRRTRAPWPAVAARSR